MKKASLLLSIIIAFNAHSQTYTDCNANSESIQQWVSAGTPLLVASKGFDCSICVNQAPMVGTWAANNVNVRVWGAMTYTYNQGATPTCSEVTNWVSNHGWQGVFAFVDSNRDFYAQGTPRYYVYEPTSGVEVYNGFSFNQATQVALSYNTVSTEEIERNQLSVSLSGDELLIQGLKPSSEYRILNMTGQLMDKGFLHAATNGDRISVNGYASGIYLIRVEKKVRKFILN